MWVWVLWQCVAAWILTSADNFEFTTTCLTADAYPLLTSVDSVQVVVEEGTWKSQQLAAAIVATCSGTAL